MDDVEQLEKPKSKYTNRGGHGGPVGNQKGLKHGYYSLVRFIKKPGGALDRRTILGKMLTETEQQLEADLGGDLSTAQLMLVEDVALDTLLLRGLNKKIVDVMPVRKGKSHPVYQLRAQLIAQRGEHLKLLDLKRFTKTLRAFHEILAKDDDNGNSAEKGREQTEYWKIALICAHGQRRSGIAGGMKSPMKPRSRRIAVMGVGLSR